jgi:L-amino acid N-acyltransferase YncA
MSSPSDAVQPPFTREARAGDLAAIRAIYNEGIADRLATLDTDLKTEAEIAEWFVLRSDSHYAVVVATRAEAVVGWASLNPYTHRCAYANVADLSIYVARAARGTGVGTALLAAIEAVARRNGFHKIVLFALTLNAAGQRLYRKAGYREVGIFREQGRLDGRFVDVIAMEKLLDEAPLRPA